MGLMNEYRENGEWRGESEPDKWRRLARKKWEKT